MSDLTPEEEQVREWIERAGPPPCPEFAPVPEASPALRKTGRATGDATRIARSVPLRWAAAALAILAAGIYWGLGTRDQGPVPPLAPSPQPLSPTSASFHPLSDGSRLWLSHGGDMRMEEAGPGERWQVRLSRGTLWADVAKGRGVARIVSEAGEIRVLGTKFVARAFRIHQGLGTRDKGLGWPLTSVLSVEVSSGLVEFRSSLVPHPSSLLVRSGQRALLAGDAAPALQESAPIRWEEAARRFAGRRRDAGPHFASLLAWRWEGIDDWEEVLAMEGAEPEARRLAAVLVASSAQAADAGRLASLLAGEEDAEVREILRAHLERLEERE